MQEGHGCPEQLGQVHREGPSVPSSGVGSAAGDAAHRGPSAWLFPSAGAQESPADASRLLLLFPGGQADPSVHDKYLFKVFPVVSVINGPLMQSMNPVSRVNLQEALLTAHPTWPTAQNVGGGGRSGGRGGPL